MVIVLCTEVIFDEEDDNSTMTDYEIDETGTDDSIVTGIDDSKLLVAEKTNRALTDEFEHIKD